MSEPQGASIAVDRKRPPHLGSQILAAMLLGGLTGHLCGEHAAVLGVLGKIVIQLIKALAVPLVFFAIIDAIISTDIARKSVLRLFLIVAINACCAASFAIALAHLIQPGKTLQSVPKSTSVATSTALPLDKRLDPGTVIAGYIPESVIQPFVENNIAGIVLLSVLLGVAMRLIGPTHPFAVGPSISFFVRVFELILLWLVKLVPIAVFGVTAKTIGEYGFKPLTGLAVYVLVCLTGLILQCLIVYQIWIAVYAKRSLRTFWKTALPAFTYAFGTNSSLATLPLTLRTLDELDVSKSASRLGACVGTNLNNDGILLYEALAALFVAQAYGIDLSIPSQIIIALLSVVAAVGVAGIPEAGVVSLTLVLTTTGMPTEILPLLLTVDWIVARARSITNVMSDMTVSIALDVAE
ncbi:MAG: dicarboxylate/amino acid:cation symporter [Bdellovibrionota bacterium]